MTLPSMTLAWAARCAVSATSKNLQAVEPVGAVKFEKFLARRAELAERLQFLKRGAVGILGPVSNVNRMLADNWVTAV